LFFVLRSGGQTTVPHRYRVLVVVSVAAFLASLDLFIVNVAFPDIRADFSGSSVASLSWVLNAYAIVFAALLVPAGRFADRLGRKRGFLAGLALFLVASAACGLAPSLEALVAARVVQAAGAALLMPTSLALLLPEFPQHERGTAIGVWAAVGGIAAAAGPPVGGLLVAASWRLVFLVNIPVGIAAGIAAVKLLRETSDATQRRPDLLGTAVLTASIGALALGFVQAPDWGWGDSRVVLAFAGAAAGLALFAWRCATHPAPVVDPRLLRVRSYAMANTAQFLFSASFAAMLLGNVLFLTSVWDESILRAGLSLAPGPLAAAATAIPAGKIGAKVGQRWLAALGSALFAAGCAWWLWRAGATPQYATAMLPGLLISGVGVGLVLPNLASAAASSLPPAQFATGSAVLTMSRQIGSVLGVAVLIAVVGTPSQAAEVDAFHSGWLVMVVPAVLGALAALAIGVVRPHVAPQPEPEPALAGAAA
jgi:EmrB/QacA subfamily drug resistance transporter